MTVAAAPKNPLTLGIHPTSRGFGWAVFESPLAPYDWGVAEARANNTKCLARAEELFERYAPETLVLEAFDRSSSNRSQRIAQLGRALVVLAQTRGAEVAIYAKGEVQKCFAHLGAATRQQVANAVAIYLAPLRHRLPGPRRCWEREDPRLSLFSAAALVLTHYQREAGMLLHLLGEAA